MLELGSSRCYVKAGIYGTTVLALFDTGADKSYMGTRVYRICQEIGIPMRPSEEHFVRLADKTTLTIVGSMNIPVVLEGKTHMLEIQVLETLDVDLVLGMDALSQMKIHIDARERSWTYQGEVTSLEPYRFVEKMWSLGTVSDLDPKTGLLELDENQQECLDSFLREQLTVCGKGKGRTELGEHVINTGKAPPLKQRYYPVTPIVQEAINTQVDEMLKEGVIEPSNSPWSSPIVLVKKANGKFRFCLDFRKLNEVTKRDSYPLPYIDAILGRLRGTLVLLI
jgi:hypothetical protein